MRAVRPIEEALSGVLVSNGFARMFGRVKQRLRDNNGPKEAHAGVLARLGPVHESRNWKPIKVAPRRVSYRRGLVPERRER